MQSQPRSKRAASPSRTLAPASAVIALAALAFPAVAQQVGGVSANPNIPSPPLGNGASRQCTVSAGGFHFVFTSSATNLVPGVTDTNGVDDVFMLDMINGTISYISCDANGNLGNGASHSPFVSPNGDFVVFTTYADNLGPTDTNGLFDVYAKASVALFPNPSGAVWRVSRGVGGAETDDHSWSPVMDHDSSFVGFYSEATNLVANDTNGFADAFLCDFPLLRSTGTNLIHRVSERPGPLGTVIQANGNCLPSNVNGSPDISIAFDGSMIAFQTLGTSLDPTSTDANAHSDVYVTNFDVTNRVVLSTELVSRTSGGAQSDDSCEGPYINRSGSHIAYWASATNLVSGDTNGAVDVFRASKPASSWTPIRVSLTSSGTQASGGGAGTSPIPFRPSMTEDANRIAFNSTLTDLVGGDTNGVSDVFVHDIANGATIRVSNDTLGQDGNAASYGGSINDVSWVPFGTRVAFQSDADDLIAGDTNAVRDGFVSEVNFLVSSGYCFGDGSGTACPCGNFGAAGHGCANSIHASGALLTASGFASLAADTLTLTASRMPNNTLVMHFQADTQDVSGTQLYDGLICVTGTVIRLGTHTTSLSGFDSFGFGVSGDPSVSVKGGPLSPSDVRHYQAFYRNAAAAFCPPATANYTNGISITWTP